MRIRIMVVALITVAGCAEEEGADADILADGPLVVVARMDAIDDAPDCGFLHVAVAAQYQVVRVESGRYEDDTIVVIHGCPELPRRSYSDHATGDVDELQVGDLHRLILGSEAPDGPSVFPDGRMPQAAFWAARTDHATVR